MRAVWKRWDAPHFLSTDKLISQQHRQDAINSLSILEAVVPTFHQELWLKIQELFPMITMALRSHFAIIWQSAARCFAAICNVMIVEAMHFVIETVLPFLGDALVDSNQQGATELIFRCLRRWCSNTRHRCLRNVCRGRGDMVEISHNGSDVEENGTMHCLFCPWGSKR
jgi:hypothetical protein